MWKELDTLTRTMMEQVPAMYLQNVQHMLPPQPQAPPAASDACLTIVHSLMCHRQVNVVIDF